MYFHVNYFPGEFHLERYFCNRNMEIWGMGIKALKGKEKVSAEEITVVLGGRGGKL